jgi:hypothetical protein
VSRGYHAMMPITPNIIDMVRDLLTERLNTFESGLTQITNDIRELLERKRKLSIVIKNFEKALQTLDELEIPDLLVESVIDRLGVDDEE